MTVDSAPRTRRAVLATGLAAAAGAVASTLVRPGPAAAEQGLAVLAGTSNSATGPTTIHIDDDTIGWTCLELTTAGAGNALSATTATGGTGIFGRSDQGTGIVGSGLLVGVQGGSIDGTGVSAFSSHSIALDAFSSGAVDPVLRAYGGLGPTAILGASTGTPPAGQPNTGVFGYADKDRTAVGVRGESPTGVGVRAITATGTAFIAVTSTPKAGTALRTIGRVRFDRSVGVATIAKGARSVTVTPGIDLSATSAVVATVQYNAAVTATVRGVAVNATADTFTIYLTGAAAATVKVAWHVFG